MSVLVAVEGRFCVFIGNNFLFRDDEYDDDDPA